MARGKDAPVEALRRRRAPGQPELDLGGDDGIATPSSSTTCRGSLMRSAVIWITDRACRARTNDAARRMQINVRKYRTVCGLKSLVSGSRAPATDTVQRCLAQFY
jgi:hypothetical protein